MAGNSLVNTVIQTAIGVIIAMYVFNTVYDAIPYTGKETAADNTTRTGMKTAVNTAFGLIGVVIIILSTRTLQQSAG